MEKEDPLERLERLDREKHQNGNGDNLRTATKILAGVAVVLALALIWVFIQKTALVHDLTDEKNELTEQIVTLQKDYDTLSSDYDSINHQLDSSREEIAQLVERIKKTDATNRRKMRQYEKELGTLRSIMRGYIVQIDSLNTLNHKLTRQAAQARKEAAESKRQNAKLTEQVEDLSGRVAAGSVIKARGLRMEAYNSAGKVIDKSSRTERLMVTLSLVENELAPKGPVKVYVRVTDPDGKLLQDGSGATFQSGDAIIPASASREIDYEGAEIEMSIYVNNIPSFTKGVYTVEAYTLQGRLGKAETLLR